VLEYDLHLDVELPSGRLRGVVQIRGLPAAERTELDCEGLEVEGVQVGGRPVQAPLDRERSKLILPGPAKGASVTITYSGVASMELQSGFFRARLGDGHAFVTQMEPIGCRRLVPCLDRPDAKAVFTLTVTAPDGVRVISNTEGASRPLADGRCEWSFPSSPRMSSYLLFLGLGTFEEAESADGNLRVITATPPGHAVAAAAARALSLRVVRGYEEYFGIPYPLPKLHLVVISDFWGAMENWGAILGADDNLLLSGDGAPAARRFAVETITHEIAHQWFGNLVTLRSWDDLWLNESFATFAVPRLHERLGLREDPWGEFLVRTRPGDLIDSLPSTHPVKPDTLEPAEVLAYADEITYFKGSRLLRMIESFLGPEAFRRGIRHYLTTHAYGNARSDDLWAALEASTAQPVVKVMRGWVDRPGFPVIEVHETGSALELRQQRFGFLPGTRPGPPWPIPLTVEESGQRRSILFDSVTLSLPQARGAEVRLDPDRTGFFRLLFEPARRRALRERAPHLSHGERWGMIHDAGAFLLSGDLELPEYLETLRAVSSAPEYATVADTAEFLRFVEPVLLGSADFRRASLDFYRAQLDRIGLEPRHGESDLTPPLRESITWGLARWDDPFARSLLPRMASIEREPVALRQAILVAFARFGPPGNSLDRLLEIVRSPASDLALLATYALGSLADERDRDRALQEALAPGIRLFLASRLVPAISGAPSSRARAWEWLRSNVREFERRGRGGPLLAQLMIRALPLVGLGRLEEVRAFFATERFPEGDIGVRKGIEYLEAFERLRGRNSG
jgi:tricorn protease interacting factor F2/3